MTFLLFLGLHAAAQAAAHELADLVPVLAVTKLVRCLVTCSVVRIELNVRQRLLQQIAFERLAQLRPADRQQAPRILNE